MNIFSDNLEKIARHNEEAANGVHTFTLGINQFADLSFRRMEEHSDLKHCK